MSTATPLTLWKMGDIGGAAMTKLYSSLFMGNIAGSLGETSALALLIGAFYLLWREHISLRIPVTYIVTVAVITGLYGQDPLFHVLSGGLILGAFFMATDYVTSPINPKGQVIFGIGCGILTALIRLFGGYPEGVCYSILIMNSAVPLIDRLTRPKRFGEVTGRA
jgi:electron transport complex protein RnfD